MMTLKVRNVNDALPLGLWWLKERGEVEETRNGKVLVMPYPISTVYSGPWERVLFDEQRDCNPFFHLAECIWILAGSNDLKWIAQFNKNMASFSDDGVELNGAYGYRLQAGFGINQIDRAVHMLKENPQDRRVVLTMWDAVDDLGSNSKDIPCNTQIYLRIRKGALDMQVNCRSNDIVWGAYGTNAVHFSFLQEYIAWAVGVQIGTLFQVSFNYHVYEQHWHLMEKLQPRNNENPYTRVGLYPIIDQTCTPEEFRADCRAIIDDSQVEMKSAFMHMIFDPMYAAWRFRKAGDPVEKQLLALSHMPDCDWRIACENWINRRRFDNASE